MITNIEDVSNTCKVLEFIGRYLEKLGVPVLGVKDGYIYFAKTELFLEKEKELPTYMRIISRLTEKYF